MKIEIQKLQFAYGQTPILRETTFSIPSGSFMGIIGPNGSGKTTMLKLLSRVLDPAGGTVLLDDRDLAVFAQKELARTMAVVAQDTAAGYLFTVEDIVMMGRAPYLGRFQSETLEDIEIVKTSLEMTGTLHLRHRAVTELSGGERQRVMIARALAQQPDVLLLDEPTSHLDIGYQQEILDLVKHLSTARGLTVAAVLHDLNLAAYYCNDLVLLHEGKIFAAGTPAEVLTAENIAHVYRTRVLVTPHPVLGVPMISLLPNSHPDSPQEKHRVHVLAGGGSGGE
ncbi:MAG: ABC transporter ATP-binding protein, partial [Bacillota bacterium]|nr:ABC transporter ATP-binding protein [Bacillota bacterium]